MAWSSAALNAAIAADTAADKPLFVAQNVLSTVVTGSDGWDIAGVATATSPDDNDAKWPRTWAYDWDLTKRTKSDTADNPHYFVTDGNPVFADFDCCLIGPNNFATVGVTQVDLQISDGSDFVSNLQTIATWTPTSNSRFASFSLKHTGTDPLVYSGVPYMRLKITMSGDAIPELSELIVGSRLQLGHKADLPYSPDSINSNAMQVVSKSGAVKIYSFTRGAYNLAPTFTLGSSTYWDRITTLFEQCNFGARPFAYCEDPATAPATWRMVYLADASIHMPYTGPNTRQWQPVLVEQPPIAGREI